MSERYEHRVLIVIPAADRERANQTALQFDANGGAHTFTEPGLSPTGALPATHYWCSTAMRPTPFAAVQALVPAQFPAAVLREYDLEAQPGYADEVLAELGLQRVTEEA